MPFRRVSSCRPCQGVSDVALYSQAGTLTGICLPHCNRLPGLAGAPPGTRKYQNFIPPQVTRDATRLSCAVPPFYRTAAPGAAAATRCTPNRGLQRASSTMSEKLAVALIQRQTFSMKR